MPCPDRRTAGHREALVSLLIPTHALPPLSYRLERKVGIGAAVVVPLSGHSRFGVVVGLGSNKDNRATENIRNVIEELSPGKEIVEICTWASEISAIPLSAALGAALPPGLEVNRYRVLRPAPGWPWKEGEFVGRTLLRRTLGGQALREAERDRRVELAPGLPGRGEIEWAVTQREDLSDSGFSPRQRDLFGALKKHESGCPVSTLLSEVGTRRDVLRRLVQRGAVKLEMRPEPSAIFGARGEGSSEECKSFVRYVNRILARGGAWMWRVPAREQEDAAVALARATVGDGEQILILAPETAVVERLLDKLLYSLPGGTTVAPYHSGLGRRRGEVYGAVRSGEVDVLVGTRAAALVPFRRLGAICVVDEPNESHRAEVGYEGVPIHVRDLALRRGFTEDAGVLFLSPVPSLILYSRKEWVRELPAREGSRHPSIRIVDMRDSGAALSSALIETCRRGKKDESRVGVVVNRLGYAAVVYCNRCGTVRSCPDCELPLALHEREKILVCKNCGFRERAGGECKRCGARRLTATGLAVERVREDLANALGEPVGLHTAERREDGDVRVVVGTARCILDGNWDVVAIPDIDTLLLGSGVGSVERAFRLLYVAVEAAGDLLLVQTRYPAHYALQAALRGDYPSFAKAELSRRRALGYPPYAHLAELVFEGPEESVRRAVKSDLRTLLEPGVEMLEPAAADPTGGHVAMRVVLRARDLTPLAKVATEAVRELSRKRGSGGVKVCASVDPEEVR